MRLIAPAAYSLYICYASFNPMFSDRCTINTNRPYTISHSQGKGGDGLMNNVNNWFSQDGKTANFNVCGDGNYVKNMG